MMRLVDLNKSNLIVESNYECNNKHIHKLFLDENDNVIFKIYFFPEYRDETIKEEIFTIKSSTDTAQIFYCFYGSNMLRHTEVNYDETTSLVETEYLHVYFINLYQNENINFVFHKDKSTTLIEKNLIQTHETLSMIPKELILYNLDTNPDFTYYFFTSESRRHFIKEHYGDRFLNAYDTLCVGAYRADYFKLLSLNILGGVYMDHKCVLMRTLNEIVPEDKEYYLVNDIFEKSILNNFMVFTKEHNILKDLIEKFTVKVEGKVIDGNDFLEFGPNFFKNNMDFKNEYKDFLFHDNKNSLIYNKKTNETLLYTGYNSYYVDHHKGQFHYAKMYFDNLVYYKSCFETQDYKFYLWNHSYSDTFEFDIRNNNLYVFRTDKEEGFAHFHRVKVVDKNLNIEKNIDIGTSNTCAKVILNVF